MCPRRSIRVVVIAVVATAALAGCGGDAEPDGATGSTTTTTTTTTAIATSTSALVDGDGEADPKLAGRDTAPLPEGVIIRFQSISRTPDPRTNHRWLLYDDGRLYLAFHSADTAGAVPFDTPYPRQPTRRLDAATVTELRTLLEESKFFGMPPLVQRQGEGGMWQVVTARLGSRAHEVVFDRARDPLADRLQQIASQ